MLRKVAHHGPFSGRQGEMRVFGSLLDAVREGDGRVLLVAGPAGIGKSELVARWVAGLREDETVTVLVARGSEAERTVPFGVVRQLFERVAAEEAQDLTGAARLGADLVAVDRTDARPAGDPDAARQGLYWLTASLAARRPLVLVVDDLHWADVPSQRFLDLLRVRLDGLPVLVVAATRERLHGTAVAAWEHDVGVRSLVLPPLGREEVGEVVEHRLGSTPEPLVLACAQATGGNPFLLRELLLALELEHLGARTPPADVDAVTPATIVRTIDARLAARGSAHRQLAAAVAVLGDAVRLAVVAAVTRLPVGEAGRLADDLVTDGILTPGRPLHFVHPLTLAAVRELLSEGERSELARRCAAVLGATPGSLDAACAHLLRADPAGERWIVDVLRRGAVEAIARGAPDTAVRYLERALEEPVPVEHEADVMAELATAGFAAQEAGALAVAQRAFEHATGPVQRLRAAVVAGHLLTLSGDVEAAVGGVSAALEAPGLATAGAPELVEEARGLRLMWSTLTPVTRDPVRELLARNPPPEALDGLPRNQLVMLAFERASAWGTAEEAIMLAVRAWDDGALLRVYGAGQPFVHLVAIAALTAGAFDLAERWTAEISAAAAAHGLATGTAVAAATRANARLGQGDVLGAEASALEALDRSRSSGSLDLLVPFVVAPLVRARLLIDGPSAAFAALEAELPAAIRELDVFTRPLWLEARAEAALAAGRPGEALADLEACRAWEQRWPAPAGGWTGWRTLAVPALLATGDRDRAVELAAEALERAERFGALPQRGRALHAGALTLDGTARVVALEDAAAVLERSGDALRHAACLVDLGAAYRQAGDPAEGRRPLERALDLADALGADVLAGAARDALVACGARPRRRAIGGASALTPAERRVAELAAAQHSNREIAEQLFVTEKTVENHLTTAYRKLGIASRAQLRGVLAPHSG